jgi:uncharacterized protein (TIGR00251 family)
VAISEEAIREHPEGSIISIKVHPSSSRRALEGSCEGPLNIWVHSPPDKGKANREALKVLSGALAIPPSRLEIIKGHTSRNKTILARGLPSSEAIDRLGLQGGQYSI